MPEYILTISGKKYKVRSDAPMSDSDLQSAAEQYARSSAAPKVASARRGNGDPLGDPADDPAARQELARQEGLRKYPPKADTGRIYPRGDNPNLLQRGAAAISEVLSVPSGVVKAAALPLEIAAREKIAKAGFGDGRQKKDIEAQKQTAQLPFGKRVQVVKQQDWRTLGMTPETQMQKQWKDRAGQPVGSQMFGAVGGFLGDLITDPTTLAAGGGATVGKAVAKRVAAKKGLQAGAQAAKVATGINRAAQGTLAAQQIVTGVPLLDEGLRTGDAGKILQGILSTGMGGLAGVSAVKSPAITLPARQMKRGQVAPEAQARVPQALGRPVKPLPQEKAVAAPVEAVQTPKIAEAGRQPWQMTLEDFRKEYSALDESIHKKQTELALMGNHPVPPEVLADYPDLAAKYTPPAETPPVATTLPAETPKGAEATQSGSGQQLPATETYKTRQEYLAEVEAKTSALKGEKMTYRIAVGHQPNAPQEAKGTVYGALGVHKTGNKDYTVTHLASGYKVASAETLADAKRLVAAIKEANWDFEGTAVPIETRRTVRQAVEVIQRGQEPFIAETFKFKQSPARTAETPLPAEVTQPSPTPPQSPQTPVEATETGQSGHVGIPLVRPVEALDIIIEARNLHDLHGSGKVGQLDWTIAPGGTEVTVAHSVTGRELGTIDLTTGKSLPVKPNDLPKLESVYKSIRESAEKTARQRELDRLKHYPARNAERIAAIEGQTGEALTQIPERHETNPNFVSPEKPVAGKSPEYSAKPTGAANRVTETERAQRGQSEVERQAYTTIPEAYEQGRAAVAAGTDARALASSVAQKPRPLTATEVGVLAYDRVDIIKKYDAATEALAKAVDANDASAIATLTTKQEQLLAALDDNDNALVKGGREQSAAFNARKMLIAMDGELWKEAGLLIRAKAAKGSQLTPQESQQFKALAAKLKDAESRLSAAESALKEAQAQNLIDSAAQAEGRRTRQAGRARTREALDKEFGELKAQFVKAASKASSGIDPELLPILGQMARNRVAAGINTVAGLVDSLHAELSEVLPDLTKREVQDALSGYGQQPSGRTQSALTKQLNDLKKQARLLSAIEDAEKGQKPAPGQKPGTPSAEVQRLRRQLDAELDKQGIKEKPKWSTDARQAMKERTLRAQIADIERRLKVGDYSPRNQKPSAVPDTPETTKLKAQLTTLREQYAKVKPEPTIAEKQAKAEAAYKTRLEKQITELSEKIAAGDFTLPGRPKPPAPTVEVKRLQAQRDLLKAQIQREIDAMKPRTFWEKLSAYQKANLLSSPRGALVDAFSTGVWQTVDNSLMRSLRGSPAEAFHAMRGMAASTPHAVEMLKQTFRHGYSQRQARRLDLPTHYEMQSRAGKVISAPARVRAGINEGQRAIGEGAELYAQAYKTARAEGATDLRARMQELIANPTEKMQAAMEAYGDEATFTQSPDAIARGINQLRYIEVGGARPFEFVVPFFNTVYNLTKTGVQHTPLGFVSLLDREVRADPVARRQAITRASVGTGAMALLSLKAVNGEMTGGVPEDQAERAQFFADGKQAYSIKIGDRWVEYKNFGPFVVPMAVTAAFWNNYAKEGKKNIRDVDMLRAAAAMAYVPLDQTNMFTLEQLLKSDPNKAQQIVGSMASTMVPFSSAARTTGNLTDEWMRDPQAWYEWVQAGLPYLREKLPIKTTGQGSQKRNIPNPQQGANALLPIQTKQWTPPQPKKSSSSLPGIKIPGIKLPSYK